MQNCKFLVAARNCSMDSRHSTIPCYHPPMPHIPLEVLPGTSRLYGTRPEPQRRASLCTQHIHAAPHSNTRVLCTMYTGGRTARHTRRRPRPMSAQSWASQIAPPPHLRRAEHFRCALPVPANMAWSPAPRACVRMRVCVLLRRSSCVCMCVADVHRCAARADCRSSVPP